MWTFAVGDLAKAGHDVPVVGFDEWSRARQKLFGALGTEQDKLEAIWNLLKTIFDGNASHERNLQEPSLLPVARCGRKGALNGPEGSLRGSRSGPSGQW